MTTSPHNSILSVEEYLQLDHSGSETRYEYIDGHTYAMTRRTIAHTRIALNMAKLLDGYLESGPYHVYTSGVRVQISESGYCYPDVTVNCDSSDEETEADTLLAPHLIVEVFSPTTEAYHRGKKFVCYQRCTTLQEYVLINAEYQDVEIFRRKGQAWAYELAGPEERIALKSLHIEFPVAKLYERSRVPIRDDDL